MTDRDDVWDSIFNRNVKRFQSVGQKRDIINDIAREFESNGMHVAKICSEIKKRMRSYNEENNEDLEIEISDSWIEKVLDPQYKRERKKNPTTTEVNTITNEEKKEQLVAVTNSGQSVSEPEPPRQTSRPDPNFQELAKPVLDNLKKVEQQNKELDAKLKTTDDQLSDALNAIKSRDSRIFNLEQQLKTVSEKKRDMSNEIQSSLNTFETKHKYDPNKLAGNDNRVFDNTIVCDLRVANWIVETLRDSIVKHPKSYFLIQQDFGKPLGIRINYLKTDFVT